VLAEIAPHIAGLSKQELVDEVVNELLGLGPLQTLLDDVDISEVMVNGPSAIYYERAGVLYVSSVKFRDGEHIRRIAERIVAPLGRHVDEASPMVDARLPDGSRVNVVLPPVAVHSPTITIRKFRADRFDMDDLTRIGTITAEAAAFLRASVTSKVNVVVSGGTGSGKTTLLNALSAFIPAQERIVTIEDPMEIQLRQPHVVTLEARPNSIEGRGEITQRDLVRNSLRMRPDRIIVGEVRGAEAFDMLQAMNTGHEGSITTVHANSPRDGLSRIENMVMMAGFDLPVRAIREQMASALHLMVQIARMPDGSRRITAITEVSGLEGDVVTLQDIFTLVDQRMTAEGKVVGDLKATGIRPRFADKFAAHGVSDAWLSPPTLAGLR
jgi:pilus assembly protein CpaF